MTTKGINLRNRSVGREVKVYLFGQRDNPVTGKIERSPKLYKGGIFRNYMVDGLRIASTDEIELLPVVKPVVVRGRYLTKDDLGKVVEVWQSGQNIDRHPYLYRGALCERDNVPTVSSAVVSVDHDGSGEFTNPRPRALLRTDIIRFI